MHRPLLLHQELGIVPIRRGAENACSRFESEFRTFRGIGELDDVDRVSWPGVPRD